MRAIANQKHSPKKDRELQVLLGLVEYYLKTGKPVGSHTLQEAGFGHLSSATIRNYFAKLENEGYLSQQHASGGRVPTNEAFRFYANSQIDTRILNKEHKDFFKPLRQSETREVASYLQDAAEQLSSLTGLAVFLSAPRFDQDYVTGIKLLPIDHSRCLCVVITDFGVIKTEIVYLEQRLTVLALKRLESYFYWRLTGLEKPENFSKEEEELAQKIYNELMVRYLISYSNFNDAELYRTGFSKLLNFKEGFQDSNLLAESLALLENVHNLRLLLKDCCKHGHLKFWIGEDLNPYCMATPNCSVISIPYYINNHVAGAVGILGPIRMNYGDIFNILRLFSENISQGLTRNLFKYKITFRQPPTDLKALEHSKKNLFLIENF